MYVYLLEVTEDDIADTYPEEHIVWDIYSDYNKALLAIEDAMKNDNTLHKFKNLIYSQDNDTNGFWIRTYQEGQDRVHWLVTRKEVL